MRRMPIACLALAAAAPAAAQPADDARYPSERERPAMRRPDDRFIENDARRLADPRTAQAVARAMAAMSDALLDVRIDKLRDAMSGLDGERRSDDARTLGDLVERDDPHFRERLYDDAERATSGAGRMARSAAELAPELQALADQFGRRIEDAIRRAKPE